MHEKWWWSRYTTYENLDSCEAKLHELMTNYSDTLVSSSRNTSKSHTEFRFTIRGDSHQLDYQKRVILNDDELYELTLIQDSSAVSEKAISKFLDRFQLKQPVEGTGTHSLLRDSSLVIQDVLRDLKSPDTLLAKNASKVLYRFSFIPEEVEDIYSFYRTKNLSTYPEAYHQDLLNFFSTHEVENFETLVKALYHDKDISDPIRITILDLLLDKETTSSIQLIKELLQQHIPRSDQSWEISSMFFTIQDKELLKPLFPELVELGTQDSVVILNYLLSELMDKNIISYQTLKPIHNLLESKSATTYQQLQEAEDEDKEEIIDENYTTTMLYGYSDKNELAKDLCEFYFNNDDSYFYRKLEAAECLLRQGELPELSKLYAEHHESYAFIMELYGLESQFLQVQVLPDSMKNIRKYTTTAALAYLEEVEYYDKISIKEISSHKEDQLLHQFIQCESQYEGEDETYQIFSYTVAPIKENGQLPASEEVLTEYNYLGEKFEAEIREQLQDLYKEWKEKQ